MGKDNHKKINDAEASVLRTSKKQKEKAADMKEEISLELAEFGNLNPKMEPMTPNNRQKSESEKTYKWNLIKATRMEMSSLYWNDCIGLILFIYVDLRSLSTGKYKFNISAH